MSKKLLIIGAGPTSSLIAYNISCCPQLKNLLDVHIWDKARGAGGRFSTSRSPNNDQCKVDLGAQYLTYSPGQEADTKKYYDRKSEDCSCGLIKKFCSEKCIISLLSYIICVFYEKSK